MPKENDWIMFGDVGSILDGYYLKRLSLFKKLLGGRVIDALLHFPSYVIEKIYSHPISNEDVGKIVTTKIMLDCVELAPRNSRRPSKVYGRSGDSEVEVLFFNQKALYLKKAYLPGMELLISGKLTMSASEKILQFINPERISPFKNLNTFVGFFNIYPLTTGLYQDAIYHVVRNSLCLLKKSDMDDWIDKEILVKNNWPSFVDALDRVHNPIECMKIPIEDKARQRLCFDEILAEQIAMRMSKSIDKIGAVIKNEKILIQKLLEILPFDLTESQKTALNEIFIDMESGTTMTRLLQGDVGSGKTIVAVLAALYAIESGYQCAILAPTEILARQHFNVISGYFENLGLQAELLTSNEKGKKRTQILNNVATGLSQLLIGTHAIITDQVSFNNLGLVVVDEQHRFGVGQRLQLIEKGSSPHILSMTATPIPRTMILSLYGDISVSSITQKPIGRKEIITKALQMYKISELIESIKNTTKKGEKVYWVCPLIEESEKTDYTCVINRLNFLKGFFGDDVEMLHGKMKPVEKQEIFRKFKEGDIHVLVATTVIEVGVDVPDATVIIIENAEKFGLSQLHQLRGRVGRSELQSYCILLHEARLSQIAIERLNVIRDSADGFYIAEKDLLLRGGGEMLGTRQSGAKKYKTFDFDEPNSQTVLYELLKQASELATNIVKGNTIKQYETLLKIFDFENTQGIKSSF